MTKTTIPNIGRLNMHIAYHWSLQVHSISCIIKTCSCLITASTSLNYCKARLVTNDFNLVCLHIINRIFDVTNNVIITVTNSKMSTV